MTKQELAAAMYETMIALGGRHNLGFERQAPQFKLLNEAERGKWVEWADQVLGRLLPSNVEKLRP